MLPETHWSGSTIGNVPIGQGIAVTPIQMASAYAAIANRGVWVQPHLVDHVGGRAARSVASRRIVSRRVARAAAGDAEERRPRGHRHARRGARLPGRRQDRDGGQGRPGPHGYSTSRYVASFVGIVPASRPRLVILVSVDEPQGAIWGGVVAAPAFRRSRNSTSSTSTAGSRRTRPRRWGARRPRTRPRPKNGSPGLLPEAIVTRIGARVCHRSVTKVLQTLRFLPERSGCPG